MISHDTVYYLLFCWFVGSRSQGHQFHLKRQKARILLHHSCSQWAVQSPWFHFEHFQPRISWKYENDCFHWQQSNIGQSFQYIWRYLVYLLWVNVYYTVYWIWVVAWGVRHMIGYTHDFKCDSQLLSRIKNLV